MTLTGTIWAQINYDINWIKKSALLTFSPQDMHIIMTVPVFPIDLNLLRAGLVDRPEKYRWNSLGYHIQTGNKDNFLSLDFGLKEFGVVDSEERLKRYRRYVYEAGALGRSRKAGAGVIDNSVLKKEREKDFELKRIQRFRYRTRYFTDSGIIGTKEFVSGNYRRFKDLFMSNKDKIPKPVAGLDGVYSLKRLAE